MPYFQSKLVDNILHLTFEDQSSRNSFSLSAARELASHLSQIEKSDQVRALVFSARGRIFCSGGNLTDYAAMTTAEEGKRVNDEIRDSLSRLKNLKCPTVCAVSGDSFGGGVELMSCFDQIIAASHVVFGLWQRKIGLSYGWGGGSRLEERLGLAKLRNLSLSTRLIGAREAYQLGLVDELVSASKLQETAIARAKALARLPKEPVAVFKSFSGAHETTLFDQLWWNDAHKAVLQSRKK